MLEKIKNRVVSLGTAFVITGVMVFGGATSAMAAPGDVVNPLVSKTYNYTSEYGGRCVPTLWASANHLGQDFSAKDGTKIRSIAKGTVSFIQQPSGSSVSGKVVVKHVIDGKTYHSAYLHMWNPTKYVKVGQSVSKGQVIAEVGSSGPSTGPHLHFEMYQGNYKTGTSINPTTFLKNQGVDIKAQATSVTTRKQPASCTYYSNGNTTLKSAANSTSSNLVSVSKGDKMTSVNAVSTQSGNYLRVTVNGKTGWLYRGYISPSYVSPDFKNGDRLKVTGQSNFRSGPTSSHSVIKKVYANEIVISTGKYQTSYYQVKSGNKTGWVHKNYLTKAPAEAVAKPKQTFTDVPSSLIFHKEIETLATKNVSNGWKMSNGTSQYRPMEDVKRDAMIVFIYRAQGSPSYTPPKKSPFTDVSTSNVFYKEIAWAYENGIAEGWKMKDGTRQFRPFEPVKRDAVAAFLMRASGEKAPATKQSFADVKTNQPHAAAMTWMKDKGISTGWKNGSNLPTYQPMSNTKRDAMAAFMVRWMNYTGYNGTK